MRRRAGLLPRRRSFDFKRTPRWAAATAQNLSKHRLRSEAESQRIIEQIQANFVQPPAVRLSQKELAAKLGCSAGWVCRVEKKLVRDGIAQLIGSLTVQDDAGRESLKYIPPTPSSQSKAAQSDAGARDTFVALEPAESNVVPAHVQALNKFLSGSGR